MSKNLTKTINDLRKHQRSLIKAVKELKAFMKPPAMCITSMRAVMTLMDIPKAEKADWAVIKVQLNDPNKFIENLISIVETQKDNLSEAKMKKIASFTKSPDFTKEHMAKASAACAEFTAMVLSVEKYYKESMQAQYLNSKLIELHATKKLLEERSR